MTKHFNNFQRQNVNKENTSLFPNYFQMMIVKIGNNKDAMKSFV